MVRKVSNCQRHVVGASVTPKVNVRCVHLILLVALKSQPCASISSHGSVRCSPINHAWGLICICVCMEVLDGELCTLASCIQGNDSAHTQLFSSLTQGLFLSPSLCFSLSLTSKILYIEKSLFIIYAFKKCAHAYLHGHKPHLTKYGTYIFFKWLLKDLQSCDSDKAAWTYQELNVKFEHRCTPSANSLHYTALQHTFRSIILTHGVATAHL